MHYISNFDSRPLRKGGPWANTLVPFDGLVGRVEDLSFAWDEMIMGDPKKDRRPVAALRLIDALRAGESDEYNFENKVSFLQTAVRD